MEVANAILSSTILLVAFGLAFWLALSKARSKIVAPETDKSIPLIRPMSNYTARVNDCLGRDILSARQMALRAAVLYPSTPLREQRDL